MQATRFAAAVEALANGERTTIVLVTRPDRAALRVARAADLSELTGLLLDQAMELGARGAYLLLASEDTGELWLHSHRHVPADIRLCLARVARGAPLLDAWAARLFARYYRTREAKAGGAAGLGLGLYIVRGLVEAHGGRIWAESAPGKTTFQFTLPLRQRAPSADREPW
ncbi:ATP-binding protein [Sorangium sp. So ce327]|jgi:hypothetical protein